MRARGGSIETGTLVTSIEPQTSGVRVIRTRRDRRATITRSAPFRRIARRRSCRAFPSSRDDRAIARALSLPADPFGVPAVRRHRAPAEPRCWASTAPRSGYSTAKRSADSAACVAAVISAEGAHEDLTQDALAREVHGQLERELGPLPPLAWHRVIAEKRATFECTVGLERPSTRTPLANVHLAGDYTDSDYPATLEAAVRSGIAAARQVLDGPAKL